MANKEVQIRAVRSDGQVFEYHGDDWGIVSVEGIDFPEIEIFKSNRGYGNGSIITGKRKKARQIDIEAREEEKLNNVEDRARAIGFHNSNYTFDLYLTYMGVTRIAKDCQLESAREVFPLTGRYARQFAAHRHPESDLLSEESASANFTDTDPMWYVITYTQGGKLFLAL